VANRQPLTYSEISVRTRLLGSGIHELQQMHYDAHIFELGRFYDNMDKAVPMLTKSLEDPVAEEVVAASGLKAFMRGLRPEVGPSVKDQKYGKHYLTPDPGALLEPVHPSPEAARYTDRVGPYIVVGREFVSVYDFPGLVAYTLTNTELQHLSNGSVHREDPREKLLELVR
jgi:hypothetical protein